MKITANLADELYSVLVWTVAASDDEHHRWAFCYSLSKLNISEYTIDSRLGVGAKIGLDKRVPYIVSPNDENKQRIKQANSAIIDCVANHRASRKKLPRLDSVLVQATEILKSPIVPIENPGPVTTVSDITLSVFQRMIIEAAQNPQPVTIE